MTGVEDLIDGWVGVAGTDGTTDPVATFTVMRGVTGLLTDCSTQRAWGTATDGAGAGGRNWTTGWKRLFLDGVSIDLEGAFGQGCVMHENHPSTIRWTCSLSSASNAWRYEEQSVVSSTEESGLGAR